MSPNVAHTLIIKYLVGLHSKYNILKLNLFYISATYSCDTFFFFSFVCQMILSYNIIVIIIQGVKGDLLGVPPTPSLTITDSSTLGAQMLALLKHVRHLQQQEQKVLMGKHDKALVEAAQRVQVKWHFKKKGWVVTRYRRMGPK